jgi:hypothetical protein
MAPLCLVLPGVACRLGPAPGPAIVFTTLPPAQEGGSDTSAVIAGRVTGARPGQRLVLFAKSGVWWVQPMADRPFTDIAANGTWRSTIHLGTEYAALLVDPGYRPAATVDVLPKPGGPVLAVASVAGAPAAAKPRKTLMFSGYEWEVRQTPSDRGGPNDYDPGNVWIDADGCMHLKLAEREGRWSSAEVKLLRSLGYGTYVFVVRDVSQIDPSAVLGLFTWDDDAADPTHRELGVEFSRWGDPALKNGQFVVQPYYIAANVFRFAVPAGRMAYSLRWEPGRATFTTVPGAVLQTHLPVVARHEFTSGVPVPGNETIRMNLYYFRFARLPPQRDVEVVIEKFQYLP